MSRIQKRFERILNNPTDQKWKELLPILKYFGLVCEPPSTGSHWVVYHPKDPTILTIPVHNNRVKKVYVKKIIKLIQNTMEEE
ncbi:MAG: type II toxin-antitoxin system HicA family toxin [Firmicutes bacterium]|nr:type II toxin-antitoxin system HicA family toxin [Bacillota bacterium]